MTLMIIKPRLNLHLSFIFVFGILCNDDCLLEIESPTFKVKCLKEIKFFNNNNNNNKHPRQIV